MVVKILEKGTTFSIGISSDPKWILNQKSEKSMSVFEFRKLIKIARNGPKIQKFTWR
jgi:hypothetical protein